MKSGNDVYFDWPLEKGEKAREVWYSLVTHPDRPLVVWYRYSLISTDEGRREGRVWFGLSDGEDQTSSFLETRSVDIGEVSYDSPFYLEMGDSGGISNHGAEGEIESEIEGEDEVSWEFSYEPDEVTFTPLRSEKVTKMAEKFLNSGRHWSFNESISMNGTVTLDGEEIEFRDAPGHQGHTAGRSIPDSWSWIHCNSFEDPSVSIEALHLDGKTSICFRVDGESYMLNRLNEVLRGNDTRYNNVDGWRFTGSQDEFELDVRVEVDGGDQESLGDVDGKYRKACYLAPDHSSRYVAHCGLADVEISYSLGDGYPCSASSSKARVEWGGTEPPVGGKPGYRPRDYILE
ncbi:MAG: tocopherol cyclase family protein [Halobacteria archaeon]